MKLFRNFSPQARFVISETGRVCFCVGVIMFAAVGVDKLASVIGGAPVDITNV